MRYRLISLCLVNVIIFLISGCGKENYLSSTDSTKILNKSESTIKNKIAKSVRLSQANTESISIQSIYINCNNEDYDCKAKYLCNAVESITVPKEDLPNNKDKSELKGCDTQTYYYGLKGESVDYEKARKCALLDTDNGQIANDGQILNNFQILEMIYANGYGVKQNLRLAIKLSCDNGEPNELIDKLNSKRYTKKVIFNVCDYSNDPNMSTICYNWLPWQVNQSIRTRKINQIIAKWPKADQNIFNRLYAANESYIQAYINSEVDLSTFEDRTTFNTTDDMEDDFFNKFIDTVNGELPNYSDIEFHKLDNNLNQIYSKIIHAKEEDIPLPTSIEGIRQSEQAWIIYKEAWVNFGLVHYTRVNPNSFRAWLIKDRIDDLQQWVPTPN